MQGLYEHSCMRLGLGPLRYIISDNRYHRIHHSIEPQHIGKNFGSFTPTWDIVFGTAHFPTKAQWPQTGLVDQDEPQTILDFLFRPFRVARDSASNR
jgi:sterol desaturase/sphingolipid hydroxylase (fatty acid hydroxylase superfamily)